MNVRLKEIITFACAFASSALSSSPAAAASIELDQDFRPPMFAEPLPAQRTVLLPDGKYVIFYGTDTLTDQRTGAITRYFPDGTLDSSFNFSRDYKFVEAAAPGPDGRLTIAAIQYTYGESFGSESVFRLNEDGSIDSSFTVSLVHPETYTTVQTIVVQPDGKTLVGGDFGSFAGVARQDIVRLLSDGTVDLTFTPPEFENGYYGVNAKPMILGDGKILIAGDFSTVNGVAVAGIARLNSDGSHDSTFQTSGFSRFGFTIPIAGVGALSDGKILITGRFQMGQGGGELNRALLIRLNGDGSFDNQYIPEHRGNGIGRSLVIQADDKAVAGVTIGDIKTAYRYEVTGSVDQSFAPPYLQDNTGQSGQGLQAVAPTTLHLQSDGRILVGGTFTDVNQTEPLDGSHFGVVRLNSDGTVDSTLTATHKTALENFPTNFARAHDDSTFITFGIQYVENAPAMPYNFGRLLANGSLDPNFALSSLNPKSILSHPFRAQNFAKMGDGRFFIFGWSDYFGPEASAFFPDGTEDLTFQYSFRSTFREAKATPDNGILFSAGDDPSVTTDAALWKTRSNGSSDRNFGLPPSVIDGQVIRDENFSILQMFVGSKVLAIQPNGKILFSYFSSDNLFHLVRLNATGALDDTFSGATFMPLNVIFGYQLVFDYLLEVTVYPKLGVTTGVSPFMDARILPDGRILLCGQFTSYNGIPARGLVRLQPDGTVDDSFVIGGGAQWIETTETSSFLPNIEAVEQQVDGKLLIAGTFEAFDGMALPGIASLNPNGSVDVSFSPPAKRQKFARGIARLARQPNGSSLLSGPYQFLNGNNATFIHFNSIGGVPLVGSPFAATAVVGQPFSYQISASGGPTSYSTDGLPAAFTLNAETGLISGTPTNADVGIYVARITATNEEGTGPVFNLTLTVTPSQTGSAPKLKNISTRLKVLAGDNASIGGFIVTGYPARRVIVRAIGPSLTNLGISGALADPVLELHGPDPFVTITNDNWKDTQQGEIEATGIPPSNDSESAIVVTLDPGAYTAVVRGKNNGTGTGLVEVYDLDSTEGSEVANISTRGFVDVSQNVMIGGIIAGPGESGSGRALIRAIGPSLTALGVPNALQNPRLELHDSNGGLLASNHDWRDSQAVAIEATGIAPADDHEAAILMVLSPGSYTAVVAGEDGDTGVGLVEVYNLD